MNNRQGFKILDGFRHAFGKPPNRPAVSMQGIIVDTAEAVSFRLYQDGTRVTLEMTDSGKGLIPERQPTPQAFGLRGIRERASLLGDHFQIVGTPGVGTTACVFVPVMAGECS